MSHLPPGFTVIDGELGIAGQPASHWASMAGDTPLFVYDRRLIAQRIAALRRALPREIGIHYAIKANPLPVLVDWMAAQVDGLDVASGGELDIALASGALPSTIGFAGPGKRDRELGAAIAAGVTINVESVGELERLAKLGGTSAVLRINPDFELKGSGMRMGGRASPFGIDAAEIPGAMRRAAALGVTITGFHVYGGSQSLSTTGIIDAQFRTIDLVGRLAAEATTPIMHVNLGGGFGIPYFAKDEPLDLDAIGTALGQALTDRAPALRETRFVNELGRFLVGEAGVYLTRVVDRKLSNGKLFIVTDGGLHHQLAASGNFGTVIKRNYPIANASRFAAPDEDIADVVGCLCTPLDRLGSDVALPRTEVGDLIAIFMAGAYGASASPTAFLGHRAATEIFA